MILLFLPVVYFSFTNEIEDDFINKKDCKISLYDDIDRRENYASFVIENAYQTELECFIAECNGCKKAKYTFEDDLNTLSIIDKIGA